MFAAFPADFGGHIFNDVKAGLIPMVLLDFSGLSLTLAKIGNQLF